MNIKLDTIKIGLFITILSLVFGIVMGIVFGANEKMVKNYISNGVEKNITLHDSKSKGKIWRYAQRSHFHATGIAAYSLALLIITLLANMKDSIKSLTSTLIGAGTLYPLSWFIMFLLAPSIGRDAAHEHILTEGIVFLSVGSIIIALLILCANLFFKAFRAI